MLNRDRQRRLLVLGALEQRAKQFRSREGTWPFRLPHEPLDLEVIVGGGAGRRRRGRGRRDPGAAHAERAPHDVGVRRRLGTVGHRPALGGAPVLRRRRSRNAPARLRQARQSLRRRRLLPRAAGGVARAPVRHRDGRAAARRASARRSATASSWPTCSSNCSRAPPRKPPCARELARLISGRSWSTGSSASSRPRR